MKRVKSLVFNTILFPDIQSDYTNLFETISGIVFSDDSGFGFSNVTLSENILSARVVKRTSTFINDYDNKSNEFLKKQIFVYSDLQFFIDFNFNILYVLGGLSQLNYLKSIFRTILNINIQIAPIDLNAAIFFDLVNKKNIDAQIEQIIINRFNFNNGIVGRFSGHVIDQKTGYDLINEYKTDIVKISFLIKLNENECFTLQVLPNGSIKFLSEESEFEYFLNYLKQLIFSTNG